MLGQAAEFDGQMVGLGGRHGWLVERSDGAVGVALQAKKSLAGTGGHQAEKNL
jgi:hypothetical protein